LKVARNTNSKGLQTMAMNQRTELGRREDLEALAVNEPEGYIGFQIFPRLNRMKQLGRLYYRAVTADAAAESSRTKGTAPTTVTLSASSTTYSATEVIKRYGVPFDEVANLGGIEAADRKGGAASKRSVMRALEDLAVDETIAGTVDATVSNNLVTATATAKAAIKRYKGRTAFVASKTAFDNAMTDTEVLARLARFTSVTPMDNSQILALARNLLAMILEVDDVLIGDDDHWGVATAGGSNNVDVSVRALIVKLPPPEEESHEMDPVLGKAVFYLPDGVQPFVIESHPNEDEKSNKYDAQAYVDFVTLNASALYVLDGIS